MDKAFISEENIGTTFEVEITVKDCDTAKSMRSGGMDVLATPRIIALMEEASFELAEKLLKDNMTTVGTMINMKHMAATPLGMKVKATAKLQESDGRRLLFAISAFDTCEKICEGTHERFIVSKDKFMSKVTSK